MSRIEALVGVGIFILTETVDCDVGLGNTLCVCVVYMFLVKYTSVPIVFSTIIMEVGTFSLPQVELHK